MPVKFDVMHRMTSIKSSMDDLDRCHELLDSTLQAYRSLMGDVARYAAIPEDSVAEHVRGLAALSDAAGEAGAETSITQAAAAGAALRVYQGAVIEFVARVRQERDQIEQAMQELASVLKQADDDHDGRIRTTVERLRSASKLPEAKAVRDVLRTAADTIDQSLEKIRIEHQAALAQLHQEIQSLQTRVSPPLAAEPRPGSLLSLAEVCERIPAAQGKNSIIPIRARGLAQSAT